MERHAAFAAAVMIRGETMQDLQRIAYHAGKIGHRLQGAAAGVAADFFLDLPRLEFHRADDDRIRLALRAWGPMTVKPDGDPPAETRQVVLDATFLLQPRIGLDLPDDPDAQPRLTLALGAADVRSLGVAPLAGGPFSAEAQAVLDRPVFRAGLALLVGQRLAAMEPSGLEAGFLGGVARAEGTTVTPVVRDGALGVGIDVFDAPADATRVTTVGDRDALEDFTDGADIAISIARVAAPLAFNGIRASFAERAADDGAELRTYTFAVQAGHFFIGGTAAKSSGTVSFSMRAVPQLTRPHMSREYDELWFDMRDIEVDVGLSWWAALAATFFAFATAGWGALVVRGMMDGKRTGTSAAIAASSLQRRAARVQEFTLAGTTAPLIRLTLERFECLAEEVFITSTLRPQIPAPRVSGEFVVGAEEAVAARSLDFPLHLPFDLQPDDPQLNVRWTVRRGDTGETVFVTDGQAQPRLTLRISNDFIPFLDAPKSEIACRVYRTLGADIAELFADTRTLTIFDRLDRSHPYVHWTHEVWTPEVVVRDDGRRDLLGYAAKGRRSKLHRTDIPGRCRVVRRFSLNQIRDAGPGVTPSAIAYPDALPFPRAELVERRDQVCDYCFFGGPTETVPKIP